MEDIASASVLVPPLRTMISYDLEAPSLNLVAVETFKIILACILLAQGEADQSSELLDEIQTTASHRRVSIAYAILSLL
jgi:hypothetical protein